MRHMNVTAPPGSVSSVLIVDDHPLYSDALASALTLVFPNSAIRQARTLGEALAALETDLRPDLVMFDLKLPDVTGISGFVSLRARLPDTPILVISSLASVELVQSLLAEGAAGFLSKDASAQTLKTVLTEIAAGRKYVPKSYRMPEGSAQKTVSGEAVHPKLAALTPQQQRIMKLICAGKPNKQIAYELSLAEATVKAHITALLRRLGVQNRTQAAVMVESAVLAAAKGDDMPEARVFLNQ
ncbi:LuxR C-terminal-related transcriptional regulator [Sedimentitalea nanhaiensis]|uniref:Two component transcriptional regulator, LuxR family n=1 Tax=Sedimentitalea nanhaiensis TaxID=999627 RepID=A0A1I7E5E4_9RHOB|nr:response regulator transcription factor [Sedimentitalea nanhaiensis]SFU19150.1 two component transcriptional regulator, LuxR family [Sedimentitalea nanhaiensis]